MRLMNRPMPGKDRLLRRERLNTYYITTNKIKNNFFCDEHRKTSTPKTQNNPTFCNMRQVFGRTLLFVAI